VEWNVGMVQNALTARRALLDKLLGEGTRDFNKECGYPEDITPAQYQEVYERVGVAYRVVSLLPEESWAYDPMVYEEETPRQTQFELAWEDLLEKQNIWHYLQRVDTLSGIGRFGILLLGLSDGAALEQPVQGKVELLYLRAFPEACLEVESRERDTSNPRFGQPIHYKVTFRDEDSSSSVSERVHWTRVIHIADNRESSETLGVPRMRPVFNRLLDIRKIMGGSAEMFWKGGFPGYSFEVNPNIGPDAEIDEDSLRAQVQAHFEGLQRYIALVGVSAKSLAPQVADPTSHYDACIQDICITLGVPRRVFEGSEEAKLASTQDMKTWNKRLNKRQEKYLSPMLIRPFINRCVELGILPPPRDDFVVFWRDLNTITDQEKAEVAHKRVLTLAAYLNGNVDQVIPIAEFLTMVMGFDPDEVTAIMEAARDRFMEEEEQPAEELQPPPQEPDEDDEEQDDEESTRAPVR